MAVDRLRLGDRGSSEPRDELGGDRADLGELQGGVAKGAVVDGHLHAFGGRGLFGEGPRPADPGYDALHLGVELKAFEVLFDGAGMSLGDPGEDLVEGVRTTHLL